MLLSELRAKLGEMSKEHPSLKENFSELYAMAVCEVEDGESEENECDIALESAEELIDDQNV
jgi:hypothetical protein